MGLLDMMQNPAAMAGLGLLNASGTRVGAPANVGQAVTPMIMQAMMAKKQAAEKEAAIKRADMLLKNKNAREDTIRNAGFTRDDRLRRERIQLEDTRREGKKVYDANVKTGDRDAENEQYQMRREQNILRVDELRKLGDERKATLLQDEIKLQDSRHNRARNEAFEDADAAATRVVQREERGVARDINKETREASVANDPGTFKNKLAMRKQKSLESKPKTSKVVNVKMDDGRVTTGTTTGGRLFVDGKDVTGKALIFSVASNALPKSRSDQLQALDDSYTSGKDIVNAMIASIKEDPTRVGPTGKVRSWVQRLADIGGQVEGMIRGFDKDFAEDVKSGLADPDIAGFMDFDRDLSQMDNARHALAYRLALARKNGLRINKVDVDSAYDSIKINWSVGPKGTLANLQYILNEFDVASSKVRQRKGDAQGSGGYSARRIEGDAQGSGGYSARRID